MTSMRPIGDDVWKLLPEPEKYNAYLCTRQWSEKKRAVRERSGGTCERCGHGDMAHVHHLTYARKYNELLSDLAGWCKECHDFTHGHSDYDPKAAVACLLLSDRPLTYGIRFDAGYRATVICPFCGCLNCHMGPTRSGDEGNQGTLIVPCWGECPHEWEIVFDGHKGTLEAFVRNGKERQDV